LAYGLHTEISIGSAEVLVEENRSIRPPRLLTLAIAVPELDFRAIATDGVEISIQATAVPAVANWMKSVAAGIPLLLWLAVTCPQLNFGAIPSSGTAVGIQAKTAPFVHERPIEPRSPPLLRFAITFPKLDSTAVALTGVDIGIETTITICDAEGVCPSAT
jgi:hypothetical protein